jgi:hypothetical protein
MDWKRSLDDFFATQMQIGEGISRLRQDAEAAVFLTMTVLPAFEEVKAELLRHGKQVEVHGAERWASLCVRGPGGEELTYELEVMGGPGQFFLRLETHYFNGATRVRVPGCLRGGTQNYPLSSVTRDELIRHVVRAYTAHAPRILQH